MGKSPTIGIIGGKGALGAHFATFFKERGLKVLVSDIKTKTSNIELTQKADITIVSVPINIAPEVIQEILPHAAPEKLLIDFSSVKVPAMNALKNAKSETLGLHPMFSNTNPISGQTVIVSRTKKSGPLAEWIINFLSSNQVGLLEMTAKEHDKVMSEAQGLIHFADIAFIDTLRRMKLPVKELNKFCSRSSELKILLAARLIAQDPYLYGNIQIANSYNLKALMAHEKSIKQLIQIVKNKDLKKFVQYFNANKDFLGKYQKESLHDSSSLIAHFIESKRLKKLSKSSHRPNKKHLAVLGPENSYTDTAARKYSAQAKYYAQNISEVFNLVETGKVDSGIVPIENKLNGTVQETIDNLFSSKVHISHQLSIPIQHCLLMLPHAKAKDIQKVISHPQALQQCSKYLKKSFPKADQIEYASTSAAVKKLVLSQNTATAVIASGDAAKQFGLKIHKSNVADQKDNSTNFIVIEKGDFSKTKIAADATKTSIAFYFATNKAGSLFNVFEIFAKAKINLTRIESRPTQKKFGQYIFYLDFMGNYSEKRVQSALEKVSKIVTKLKVLGSY